MHARSTSNYYFITSCYHLHAAAVATTIVSMLMINRMLRQVHARQLNAYTQV